jgi:hypothetical protein
MSSAIPADLAELLSDPISNANADQQLVDQARADVRAQAARGETRWLSLLDHDTLLGGLIDLFRAKDEAARAKVWRGLIDLAADEAGDRVLRGDA